MRAIAALLIFFVLLSPARGDFSSPLAYVTSDGLKIAEVKAASTAATATDQALVVAISPNNNVSVAQVGGTKASYSTSIVALTTAALATDVFTITGSASKTIRVTRVEISAVQTTLGDVNVLLVKRSTANSGGTSTSPTVASMDSTNAAASGVVRAYTANPTTGTSVGTIRVVKLFIPTSSSNSSEVVQAWDFGTRPAQTPILRGTSEVLALNLNGATVAGGSFNISIEWTEE